jgi:hypothetical protein
MGWLYLITGIGIPVGGPRENEQLRRWELREPRAWIEPFYLRGWTGDPEDSEPSQRDGRYFVRFAHCRRDDDAAQRIADAMEATLRLLHGPMLPDHSRAIRFPRGFQDAEGTVRRDDLVAFDHGKEGPERIGELFITSLLMHSCHVPVGEMNEVFRMLPVTVRSPYFEAIHFYREATDDFYFHAPDDVYQTIDDPDRYPSSQADRAKVEQAIVNANKVIEAIIGDPPNDEKKFRAKLMAAGIPPDEMVGYCSPLPRPDEIGGEPVAVKIRKMGAYRDKKGAHGSQTSKDRTITYYELMDFQACARECLFMAIEHAVRESRGCPASAQTVDDTAAMDEARTAQGQATALMPAPEVSNRSVPTPPSSRRKQR